MKSLAIREELAERADSMASDGAGGSGRPETPGRTSNIEGDPGFTPTNDTFAYLPRLCYDHLGKFDEKNRGLLFVSFFFAMFPIAVINMLVV